MCVSDRYATSRSDRVLPVEADGRANPQLTGIRWIEEQLAVLVF